MKQPAYATLQKKKKEEEKKKKKKFEHLHKGQTLSFRNGTCKKSEETMCRSSLHSDAD